MKLGAQFYTLHEKTKTPEGLRDCFRAMSEIGYSCAQMSAICPIEAEKLRDFSEEYSLPITCTHSPFDRVINDTDALIREHRIYVCETIGLGSMPNGYIDSIDGVRAFMKAISEPMKKIEAAGLRYAYHNHYKEFIDLGGVTAFDLLTEEAPSLNFILDVYWTRYAGADTFALIDRLGKEDRLVNIHFKDMKSDPKGPICPCGAGVIDFSAIYDAAKKAGVRYALVEQDNAFELGDEFAQMKESFDHLSPLFQ